MTRSTEITSIKAAHSYTIYNKNGWAVVKYKSDDDGTIFTACGNDLPTASDTHVTLYGEWVSNQQYGRQFNVSFFEEILPTTEKGVISYFRSLKVGIATKKAAAIYKEFGERVWDVLENDPQQLTKVRGISDTIMASLLQKLHETQNIRHVLNLFRGECDASPAKAKAVVDRFGEHAEMVVSQRPYLLCSVPGFSFPSVDAMALGRGYPPTGKGRLIAAVLYLFETQSTRGHVCIPISNIRQMLQALLRSSGHALTEEQAGVAVNAAVAGKLIAGTKTYLYLARRLDEEKSISDSVIRLLGDDNSIDDVDVFIDQYQKESGVSLAEKQADGVRMVLRNSFSILTGGPGTGKTTTIKAILYVHKLVYGDMAEPVLLAPTGKAARRMSEATGYPAATVHSAIKYIGEEVKTTVVEGENQDDAAMQSHDAMTATDEKLQGNLIIVDEASMLDQTITKLFFDKVPDGARVVFVGDPDQLPSVGCGNILLDMLQSGVVPVTKLNVIYRQGADSPIIRNAHAINEGNTALDYSSSHFKFIPGSTPEETFNIAVKFYVRCVRAYGLDNVILLCPYRNSTDLNVNVFNKTLQGILNPVKDGALTIKCRGIEFRDGDRIMQMKNTSIAKNGDTGYIRRIEKKPCPDDMTEFHTVAIVEWNDDKVEHTYSQDDMRNVDLAYCTTVHKSQGSEYQTVLLISSNLHSTMLKRNVVYTGVTRAKTNVAIIGEESALAAAIQNNTADVRYTLLAQRLQMGAAQSKLGCSAGHTA